MPNITEDQKILAHVRYTTQSAQDAPVSGDVVWEVDDPAVVRFETASLGNRDMYVVAIKPGSVHITATAMPTDDPEVSPIVLEADINVIPGVAVHGFMTFDAPIPR